MKITKILMILFVAISIVSCKSDDDNNTYTLSADNFIGVFTQNFLKNIIAETVTFSNGTTSTSTTTVTGIVLQDVDYTFNANNTFEADGLLTTRQVIVEANGDTTTEDDIIVALDINGTYTLNVSNNTLSISYQIVNDEGTQNISKQYEITKYTETEMNLEYEQEITVGDITTTTSEELRFTR